MDIVYLAGTLDDPKSDVGQTWRKDAKAWLGERGFSTFDPGAAFQAGGRTREAWKERGTLQDINYAAIRNSAGVLVELRGFKTRYVGTLMELGYAIAHNKPVVLWTTPQYLEHLAIWHPSTTVTTDDLGHALQLLRHRIEQPGDSRPALEYAPNSVADSGHPDLRRAYAGDAGLDLPTARGIDIPPRQFVDVPLAFRMAPPPGYWFRLVGRSSTLRKFGLLVNEGIIDQGWRGQLFAGVYNLTDRTVRLEAGQRIVQAIIERVHADEITLERLERVADLRPGDRGENGFGSTGYGAKQEEPTSTMTVLSFDGRSTRLEVQDRPTGNRASQPADGRGSESHGED